MNTSYRPTGLVRHHPAAAYRGYTLFSPNGGDDAYLVEQLSQASPSRPVHEIPYNSTAMDR